MTHHLHSLIQYLDSLSAPADLSTLRRLLGELDVTADDLAPYVHFDNDHYARNKISQSRWYELVCLCWAPEQRTPIHDHRASSCAFLVVQGAPTEVLYELGADGKIAGHSESFRRDPGYICAAWDADIHEVSNPTDHPSITLHIYSPALTEVHIYSRQTGEAELWSPQVQVAKRSPNIASW